MSLSQWFRRWETGGSGTIAVVPSLLCAQAPMVSLQELRMGTFSLCCLSGHPHKAESGRLSQGWGETWVGSKVVWTV